MTGPIHPLEFDIQFLQKTGRLEALLEKGRDGVETFKKSLMWHRRNQSSQTPDMKNKMFKGIDFYQMDLSGVDFTGSEFHECNLSGCNFTPMSFEEENEPEFSNENLTMGNERRLYKVKGKKRMQDCVFHSCDFSGASLKAAKFNRSVFKSCRMDGADLRWGFFKGCLFDNSNVRQCKIRAAYLRDAKFKGCDMAGMDLTGCDLSSTQWYENNFVDGVSFRGPASASGELGPVYLIIKKEE